jgi:transcriptional regulator with XRE-family HTH domain
MPKPVKTDPYPFSATIGPRIKQAKTDRGLSDKKFSDLAGVSRRHLVEFQKGANATLLIAFRAMRALGIRELAHDFEGETLTLAITDATASVHPTTLIETAESIERVIGSLLHATMTLRDVVAKGAPNPASEATNLSLAQRVTAIVNEFGTLAQNLDDNAKLDLLQRLTHASTAQVERTSTAPPRKRTSRGS